MTEKKLTTIEAFNDGFMMGVRHCERYGLPSALNDTVVEDEKPVAQYRNYYLQSEVDAIRKETWEASREHHLHNELKDGVEVPVIKWHFSSLERFLNLNTNDTGKPFDEKEYSEEQFKRMKKATEQPANDNAFVWDGSVTWLFDKLKTALVKEKEYEFGANVRQLETDYNESKQSAPEPSALPNKEYEILSFVANTAVKIYLTRNEDGTFGQYSSKQSALLSSSIHSINSVRRLSDNTVWEVEEKFSNNAAGIYSEETIKSFEVWGNKMKVRTAIGEDMSYYLLEHISKLPPTPTQPVVEDKRDIIIEQLKGDLKRVKEQRNEYEIEQKSLYRRITNLSAEVKDLKQKLNK